MGTINLVGTATGVAGAAMKAGGGLISLVGGEELGATAAGRLAAQDVLFGVGKKINAAVANTPAGRAFLEAYADVYNSKLNPAIVGTKKPIVLPWQVGAETPKVPGTAGVAKESPTPGVPHDNAPPAVPRDSAGQAPPTGRPTSTAHEGSPAGIVHNSQGPSATEVAQRELLEADPTSHTFERHGGAVTDEELETRARTGVAPDGSTKSVGGQTLVPPYATAFHTDELAVRADQAVRNGPLQQEIASHPGATEIVVKSYDVGFDVGRGYQRVGDRVYQPGVQGPVKRVNGLTKVTGVYKLDPATGRWLTTTIYPEP